MSSDADTIDGVKFHTINILEEVGRERRRQDEKWGEQNHPWYRDELAFGHGPVPTPFEFYLQYQWRDVAEIRTVVETADDLLGYADILMEEVAEALDEQDIAKVRAELIQVAAVAVAAIESIDRNGR